eukprot:TRINITY_DN4089_c0_g1_i4.p1 TRINITY_DN4089_c0_g1~~TRINITY_DN4089_c0_g1_i4.p1  ORF type:complete len:684 (-),score=154.63 TRINITY_DN4089_c0_g1_i4:259-2310(-)
MSTSAAREARARELEEKKKRLLDYRNKHPTAPVVNGATTSTNTPSPNSSPSQSSTPSTPSRNATASPQPTTRANELDRFINSTLSSLVPPSSTPTRSTSQQIDEPQTEVLERVIRAASSNERPNRRVVLSVCPNVVTVDIPPREVPTYTKETQTRDTYGSEEDDNNTHFLLSSPTPSKKHLVPHLPNRKDGNVGNENSSETTSPRSPRKEETQTPSQAPIELDPEEKERIESSDSYIDFVTKSTRIIERALAISEKVDFMADYSKSLDDETRAQSRTNDIRLAHTLFDERWSKHRSITDISWSTKHPELILTAYSANDAAGANDPDGVVLIWSVTNFYQSPEYVFHCQSPVMTSFFSKFHSTLVVGGTYSGQVVMWDTRAKSTPVQRTPLSSVGHTHPIYAMAIVGTPNAHNLVSISTDGKMCVWSMDNLNQPTESLELNNKAGKAGVSGVTHANIAAPVAVTSLSFPEGDVNGFLVGSEEGTVYQAFRHGTKSGIAERFDGHFGPITGTDCHPSRGNIDFSHLFLSASTDWTVKLWSTKNANVNTHPVALYSFEDSTDYVYDVRWSPAHPSVFVSVDGAGYADFWNLNEDLEAPIVKSKIGSRALNRAAWSLDAKKIAIGDSTGSTYIYEVGELGVAQSQDEWTKFESLVNTLGTQKMGSNTETEDEDVHKEEAETQSTSDI